MPIWPTTVLPRRVPQRGQKSPAIQVASQLLDAAGKEPAEVLQNLQTTKTGLSAEEAKRRLVEHGPNVVAHDERHPHLQLLIKAIVNPLVLLLLVLATVSFLTDDGDGTGIRAGAVMLLMVVLGVVLRFVQEARADNAAAKLRAMISVRATVVRDGKATEEPVGQLVPGDVVELCAGDMVPADIRILSCKDLFVTQAAMTGESFPVEKFAAREETADRAPLEFKNVCYLGTSVESGAASAVVVTTGMSTYLGSMSKAIVDQPTMTSFDRGVSDFTWLMIRFMMVMVPLVFVINALTKTPQEDEVGGQKSEVGGQKSEVGGQKSEVGGQKSEVGGQTSDLRPPTSGFWEFLKSRDWKEAFLFALAVAVGLTPEMLPMIVSVCLSKGALAMSRKRVIVKRLNSIQNLGAMDILCTDKTGTLTMDRIILEKYCDVVLQQDAELLDLAYLNSYFQTGLKNLLDRAVLEHTEMKDRLNLAQLTKADEIPFDFSRRIMSVVVQMPNNEHRLICKGAPEEVYRRCKSFELDGEIFSIEHLAVDLKEEFDRLSSDGFRVLALAYKNMQPKPAYSKEDESDMILRGYLAFLDPPKDSARTALAALQRHGISVKVVTGDNELVSQKICKEVGIATDDGSHGPDSPIHPLVLLGSQIEKMSDADLAKAAEKATLFARVSPAHKQRIIKTLRGSGHVVGFLGDGINDAPALRAADVGISVDTAVDIAKESADVILLEKDLHVLEEGVLEGRKVFANILKYIRMGASSNFGNMFSVLGASAFLKFFPMAPLQILTNNLLYDVSQVPIPTDDVDPEQVAKPHPWSMKEISRFMLFIGPCSSVFDYTTFFIMLYVFDCWDKDKAKLFQTGWFVESLLTQTLIIHIIRTNRVPFLQSWASWPLIVTTISVMAIGVWLPYSPIAEEFGFVSLPAGYWPLLVLTLIGYILLTQGVKTWLLNRKWLAA
jgi:Mg2+-importing ATPase